MIGYCRACDVLFDDLESFGRHCKCSESERNATDRDHRKPLGYALMPLYKRQWHHVEVCGFNDEDDF